MSIVFETVAGYEPLLSACGLDSLEAVFQWDRGERLDKPGLEPWRQRWRISLAGSGQGPETFYLKRFLYPPWRRQWDRWRQGHWLLSTAGVEWRNSCQLARAGIPAAEAVAFGQEMTGPWERRSFILLKSVRGTSLEKWVPQNLPALEKEADRALRRQRLDRLARFVASFHKAGFVHRDLYLAHIFLEPATTTPAGPEMEAFRLIDLQRVFRPWWRRQRWTVKDLAALHYSTPDDRISDGERLQFLARYVRVCGRSGQTRRLGSKVQAKARRVAAHQYRGQAPRTAGTSGKT
jgi:hypothetical protein